MIDQVPQTIFGCEEEADYKRIKKIVGSNGFKSHTSYIESNDCWMVYNYISKKDYDTTGAAKDSEGVKHCKVRTAAILGAIQDHFENIAELGSAFELLTDMMQKIFCAELMKRLSDKGTELHREGTKVKLMIDSDQLDADLLKCLYIKKHIEEGVSIRVDVEDDENAPHE